MTADFDPLAPVIVKPSDSPFSTGLKQLAESGAHGGLVTRYDIATKRVRGAFAVKAGKGLSVGAEFTWDTKAHEADGYVGLVWTFGEKRS